MNTRSSKSSKAFQGSARTASSSSAGAPATATAASSAQGNSANTTGQTSAANNAQQEPNTSTGGEAEASSPVSPKPMAQIPMTVHNLPVITFHDKNEKLFMDDKHIDAFHPQHVPLTSADVENLHTQLHQFSSATCATH